jgi:hypothetical protein
MNTAYVIPYFAKPPIVRSPFVLVCVLEASEISTLFCRLALCQAFVRLQMCVLLRAGSVFKRKLHFCINFTSVASI